MDIHYMTQEGYDKLQSELEHLKNVERRNIARDIAEAREKGDLSENAEYHAAKDAQGLLEFKISEMDKVVANARVIDKSQLDTSKVTILSKVTVKNIKNGATATYELVSESEADMKQKKISVGSPLGQGLLGKKQGEIAEVETPRGVLKFEVVEISI